MRTLATLLCLLLASGEPAFAYLKYSVTVGGRPVIVKWSGTVRYFLEQDSSVPGVTASAFQAAVTRAFGTWEAVPTASIRYEFGGLTAARPLDDDGRSTIGFLPAPQLDRVLASTSLLVDSVTGELVESDIFFNSVFSWSVAPGGGGFDLESIAVHEIGHLSGVGHSALGETELGADGGRRVIAAESVMFPIAFAAGNIAGRTLKADDVAAISDLYPEPGFAAASGSLSGSVTRDGRGIVGAHVVAFNPASGDMVGGFTFGSEGRFSIGALSPGVYVVRVEPLDDADVNSFFGPDQSDVAVDFRVGYAGRLVAVPKGGDSGAVGVRVVRK